MHALASDDVVRISSKLDRVGPSRKTTHATVQPLSDDIEMSLVGEIKFANEEGRLDRYWAAAISITLHLAVAVWLLVGTSEIRSEESTLGTSSGAPSLRWLGEDEFRQPLAALPPAKSVPVANPEPEVMIDPTPLPLHAAANLAITEPTTSEQTSPETSVATAASTMPNADAAGQAASSVEVPLETPRYDSREQAYLMALRAAIQSKWTRQSTQGGRCAVTIQQTIGGQVTGAISKSCILGQSDRRALEAAALAAQPLPYAGFERVFREQITVEME
jgi:hypothetical protein